MNKFLYWLTGYLHCRIMPNKERYYITNTILLHRFLSGDGDRRLHNHPWRYAFSFILTGKYIEVRRQRSVALHKWFNIICPDTFHRIVSIAPNTWTLSLVSRRSRNWGFIRNDGAYYIMNPIHKRKPYQEYPLGRDVERAPL